MSNAAAIARFLVEERKPALAGNLSAMSDEAVGQSIVTAVSDRFPDYDPDDFMQGAFAGPGDRARRLWL